MDIFSVHKGMDPSFNKGIGTNCKSKFQKYLAKFHTYIVHFHKILLKSELLGEK